MLQITRFTTGYRSKLILEIYQHWLKGKERVLDVGCGDGIMSSIIGKHFGVQLTGCDIENYLKISIPFSLMQSGSTLPFKKNAFGWVMFNDVFHHMSYKNQSLLLQEALRVGQRVLIFEVEPTLAGGFADFIINKFHNISMPVPLTFRTHEEWIGLFHTLNVSCTYIQPKRPFFYPFSHESFMIRR